MNNGILNILLVVAMIVVSVLLIVAYVVAPIIGWLISNPIAGLGLLVILLVLVAALFYKETRD